ncbi:hypothetical protein Sjap_002937 [Stephania japonica]|uniref:Lipid-binding serum glycoprotein C-terminal domain-containing protein n=1 Tax=Stephania japonica TaxID=461633 RepID=A0AAP0KMS6_9MAGN
MPSPPLPLLPRFVVVDLSLLFKQRHCHRCRSLLIRRVCDGGRREVVRVSGSVDILNNNLAGTIDVDNFSLSLKWSQVGKFHMSLIQSLMWTLIKTVALPYANTRLRKGFPLPLISGFTLQSASITYVNSRVLICSDVVFRDAYNFEPLGLYNYWRR